jgi:hypothetical protein
MKGASDLVNGILHIRIAHHFWDSFSRELAGTKGANLMKNYSGRLEWIYNDLMTNPAFPSEVREGFRSEWKSDTFVLTAMADKLPLLTPEQRLIIEQLVDAIIAGEEIQIVHEDDSKKLEEKSTGK